MSESELNGVNLELANKWFQCLPRYGLDESLPIVWSEFRAGVF